MADQYRKESDMYRGSPDRPWTNRAGDEVRSWLGDDEARQRRERDDERQGQESRQARGWEDEREWYRSGSNSSRSAGSRPGGWDDNWHRQESGRNQGSGRQAEGRPYGGREYGPNRFDTSRGSGNQPYRDDSERQYRGGEPGGGMGGDYRTGSTGRNSLNFGASAQFDRGEDWQTERGGGAGAYTGGGSQPAYEWTSRDSFGGSSERAESHFGKGPKGYQRSDERIREEVSDQLTFDHSVDASELTVDVKGGEVTLSGSVRDREQKRRAEDIAERVKGVSDVTNNIRVTKSDMNGGSPSGAASATGSQGSSGLSGMSDSTSGTSGSSTMGRNKATSGS